MLAFRFLTGPDDARFCHRVTEALGRGWRLHGGPTLTYDYVRGIVVAGQALVKEVEITYSGDLDLAEL